jgi:pyridoxine/pyridoxamine 5'-phosphate oxidase
VEGEITWEDGGVAEPIETLSGDPTLDLPEFDDPPADPLPLLDRWLRLADERGVREPRALALATADAEGRPSSRILLLKQVTPALVFSGSYESRKGRELAANPRAAGTLYWRETLQQVTVEGPVRRLSEAESDEVFGERPPDAQVITVASEQGRPLEDPGALRQAADALAGDVPRAGAAGASTPTWSSSGTAAPTASTAACST